VEILSQDPGTLSKAGYGNPESAAEYVAGMGQPSIEKEAWEEDYPLPETQFDEAMQREQDGEQIPPPPPST